MPQPLRAKENILLLYPEFFDSPPNAFYVWSGSGGDSDWGRTKLVIMIAILDNGKPVVRRGRKAMGSWPFLRGGTV
jgi:hypothetical protein